MAFWLGRVVRSIWRWPFYVGPLVRPVSTGDALLKFLETIWRAIVIAFALILASALFVVLAIIWENANRPPSLSEVVRATVKEDRKVCNDANFPLLVAFDNPSERSVENINFKIEAREPGHSTDLSSELVSWESDQIIPPKSIGRSCWSKPEMKQEVAGPIAYSIIIEWGSWEE
jgi:hypothetical protein